MDADGRIIEITEDDMGEGFKDEVPPEMWEKIQINEFEKRMAGRKDPEPPSDHAEDDPKLNHLQDLKVVWYETLPREATVLLLLGTDGDAARLFAQPYRVAGSRENGKLILKPVKPRKS